MQVVLYEHPLIGISVLTVSTTPCFGRASIMVHTFCVSRCNTSFAYPLSAFSYQFCERFCSHSSTYEYSISSIHKSKEKGRRKCLPLLPSKHSAKKRC